MDQLTVNTDPPHCPPQQPPDNRQCGQQHEASGGDEGMSLQMQGGAEGACQALSSDASFSAPAAQQPSEMGDEMSPGSASQSGPTVMLADTSAGGDGSTPPLTAPEEAPTSQSFHFPVLPAGKHGQQLFPDVSQSAGSVSNQMEERMTVGRLASSCGEKREGELLARCETEYNEVEENYLRGCKWSPDGRLLMTNSNDNVIRIFNLPKSIVDKTWNVDTELTSSRKIPESDLIYDYAWYPGMTITDPNSCLFATSVRDIPIHMFSAFTGKLVCSFRSYNHVDEIVAAHSVGFTSDGKHLVAGFNRKLRCFDVNRPGRDCMVVSTVSKDKDPFTNSIKGQRGILSCFAAHPTHPTVVAAGAFNGDVAIYDLPTGAMSLAFEGQVGGITHVCFSEDGNYLFAGGRKDPEIHVFDMRNPEKILCVLYRYVATNQRMYFDIDKTSQYLMSGHHNGHVTVWDLHGQPQSDPSTAWPRLDPVSHFAAHEDTTNGLHINPQYPVLATCSGQRHFPESIDMDNDDSPSAEQDVEENSLKLWSLQLP